MPHVPFLRHPHQRRVDHALAMRVVITAGVARNLSALHSRRSRRKIEVVHGDQNASLGRLETVSYIGQGAADNDAHGVCQVTLFEFLFDRYLDQPTARNVTQNSVRLSFQG